LNIAILSRNEDLYSTRRLVEAAELRGHEVSVIDYARCYMNITSENPSIHYKGNELPTFDAIIPRISPKRTFYGTAVVRQFETKGTFSINPSIAITRSRDKLRSQQLLSRKGIGLPITGFANSATDIDDLIQMVGGAPLIIKLIEGTQGVGVVLAENINAAESVIQAFMGLSANIIIQEFIQEAKGSDIRCFVVGDKVVASIKRQGEDDFRSNIHRGGSASTVKITKVERETAIQAAKIMGLKMAGVDLLRSKRGPLVMEVNSSPGLEGIETTTEVNIAEIIIDYIEKHAKPITLHSRYEG
jgi:ribosomal protein S6--L-glutamate ligase